jgi:methionyl-tRNA synthetase
MWKCGSTLNATDLINPKSTITGETPIMNEELVLPLDRYEDFLKSGSLLDIKATGNPMFTDK